jgi:hypothetical protein
MPAVPPATPIDLGLLSSWWKLVIAALGAGFSGSFGVKVMDYGYQEFQRSRDRRVSAQEVVEKHLDPILKAGEDLVGELRSLALHDFVEFKHLPDDEDERFESVDLTNLLFLFGQFWSRIQILRREATYASIGRNPMGSSLKSFLDGLESRNVRVLERPLQRGIGDSLIRSQAEQLSCLSYYEFVKDFSSLRPWFNPLAQIICESANPKAKQKASQLLPIHAPIIPSRQLLLRYGAIVHAMLDTLDPKHALMPNLRGWPNKFTVQTRKSLARQVFPVRLPFVKDIEKYIG